MRWWVPKILLKYVLIVTGAVVGALVLWFASVYFLPPSVLYYNKIQKVDKYVAMIEKFRIEHGYYPFETEQKIVPREEHNNPFYYRKKDGGFVVGFSVGPDENYYYNSVNNRWSFEDFK